MIMENPYAQLGAEAGEAHAALSDAALRDLYRFAAWLVHPDRTRRDTSAEFSAVCRAYAAVKDAPARERTRRAFLLRGWAPDDACNGSGAVPGPRRALVTCMRCAGLGLVPPGAPTVERRIRKLRKMRD